MLASSPAIPTPRIFNASSRPSFGNQWLNTIATSSVPNFAEMIPSPFKPWTPIATAGKYVSGSAGGLAIVEANSCLQAMGTSKGCPCRGQGVRTAGLSTVAPEYKRSRMRPTIKNKLVGGFTAVLILMVVVAGIGVYSVLSLRRSALETARVGDRLNSISLEIQVHNLEAQRKIKSYLTEFKQLGAEKARETYLDEAEFEIHEIESLAKRGYPYRANRGKTDKVPADCYRRDELTPARSKVVAKEWRKKTP